MAQYKILNPIGYGGRIERGAIVELPDEVAKAYGAEYVEPYTGEVVKAQEEKVEEVPLSKLSVAQLRAKAKDMNLDTEGSKADLIERITLASAE